MVIAKKESLTWKIRLRTSKENQERKRKDENGSATIQKTGVREKQKRKARKFK